MVSTPWWLCRFCGYDHAEDRCPHALLDDEPSTVEWRMQRGWDAFSQMCAILDIESQHDAC